MISETTNNPYTANSVNGTAKTARRILAQRRSIRTAQTMHEIESAATKAERKIAARASGTINILRFYPFGGDQLVFKNRPC
jgi:hypothetical protein